MKKIKKPISILLSVLMVLSVFAVVPFTASAAVGDFVPESEYLTFTAEEAGSSVTLNYTNGTLKYNKNNSDWVDYTKGAQIDLENVGDSVRFRGKDTTFYEYNHVSIGGKVACSGNVMSLRLDDTGKVQGLSDRCFYYMFNGCTGLTAAPELPETTLAYGCYNSMFYGCTSLTTAPELPAKMLESYCYSSMFSGCESLTTAPELPATTLAVRCYNYMFSGCTSLTTAPALPATTLATYCYYGMFYGCTSLTAAPALPATELVTNCYASMFNGCTGIKLSTTQTAEYSIPYSVPSGGNGTLKATNALNNMFVNTGGTFKGKPEINTTYYMYVPKYTVTWNNWDGTPLKTDTVEKGGTPVYSGETPVKAEDEQNTYTFSGWTDGTTTYGTTDTLPAVNGDVTYTAQFDAVPKIPVAYYIVGTMNGWTPSDAYKLTKNPANDAEYMFTDLTVSENTELKVMDSNGAWYPEPENFKLNDAGTYDIYFRPDGKGGDGWHHGNIFANNYRLPTYTVTWKNEDGTTLKTDTLEKDAVPAYTGTAPEKAEDERNTYTFSGWTDGTTTYGKDDALPAVSGDITYTATFDETAKVIKDCTYKQADSEVYANVPFMPVGGDYSSLLDGAISALFYDGSIQLVDAKGYSYKFYDQTGTEIASALYNSANFPGSRVGLSGDVTVYRKMFDLNLPENFEKLYIVATAPTTYTVTWQNGDTVLKTDTVVEGNAPAYTGTAPEKAEDEQNTYTFSGWTDGTNTYGKDDALPAVTGDVTYTATFDSTKRSYTITWKNDDGSVIDTNTVEYGETPTHAAPVKAEDDTYTYTFSGWTDGTNTYGKDDALPAVTGDVTYTATFDSTKRSYTITWKNDDGSVIDTNTVEYGETPTHAAPEKAEDAQNTYTFSGWTDGTNTYGKDDTLPAVTGDVTYTATFTATEKHLNGPQDDGYFYLNDVKQIRYQLIQWHGDYYFINDGDKYAKNAKLYLSNTYVAGTGLAAGLYEFGADGKMQLKNGPQDDGYFYENGIRSNKLYRFVEFEGDWYFIYDAYKYAKNAHLYLSGAFLEGTDFAPGYFDFDADGKYYIPEELPEGANADGYFYINGVKQTRYQLIKYGNDYYFINDGDKYAKNTKLYLSDTFVSGTDLPAGLYEFGADGKMIISALKNGPQDDGYFYINGARCQKLYRFVEFDGDWYFINDGYKYAKNARLYLGNAFLEGTDFAPGYFVFGADGKLVTA